DRASALLADAGGGEIRLDAATAELLSSRFELERGATATLLRALPDDERPRTVLGREIPCVGRDREIATLIGLWQGATVESGARAVLVTAPAGGGKSRVRRELIDRLRSGGERFQYLMGRGDPVRAGAPFALLGPALRGAAGLLGGEPADVRQRRLLDRVE